MNIIIIYYIHIPSTRVVKTHAEFNQLYFTYQEGRGNRSAAKPFDSSEFSSSLPYSIDWRTKGAVSSIKNQVKQAHSYITYYYTWRDGDVDMSKWVGACNIISAYPFTGSVWGQLCLQCCGSSGGGMGTGSWQTNNSQ